MHCRLINKSLHATWIKVLENGPAPSDVAPGPASLSFRCAATVLAGWLGADRSLSAHIPTVQFPLQALSISAVDIKNGRSRFAKG